jgi:hypothetical protein
MLAFWFSHGSRMGCLICIRHYETLYMQMTLTSLAKDVPSILVAGIGPLCGEDTEAVLETN